jgi:hypothetical protein
MAIAASGCQPVTYQLYALLDDMINTRFGVDLQTPFILGTRGPMDYIRLDHGDYRSFQKDSDENLSAQQHPTSIKPTECSKAFHDCNPSQGQQDVYRPPDVLYICTCNVHLICIFTSHRTLFAHLIRP